MSRSIASLLAAALAFASAASQAATPTVYTDRPSFVAALAALGLPAGAESYDTRALGAIANGQVLGAFSYGFDPAVNGAAVASDGNGGHALGGVPNDVFVGGDAVTLNFQGAQPLQAFGADFFYAPSFLPAPASIYRMAIVDGAAAGTTAWNGPDLDPAGGSFFLGFIGGAATGFRGLSLFSVVPAGADGVPFFLDAAYQVDNLVYAATSPVPEPATAWAMALGAALVALRRRQTHPPR
jgi:PEP-CTERM motif